MRDYYTERIAALEKLFCDRELDVKFLLNRAMQAGCCSFREDRDTGLSSNSIVAIAYNRIPLDAQELPADANDLAACENMWCKLPGHRKTMDATEAMQRARMAV